MLHAYGTLHSHQKEVDRSVEKGRAFFSGALVPPSIFPCLLVYAQRDLQTLRKGEGMVRQKLEG